MLIKLNLQRFAAVIYAITMNYDSNVTSVDDNKGTVFTTSGETKTVFNENTTYTFTVGMTQGYELDSVTSDEGNISNVSGNSFQFINSYDRTANITITTKKATSQVTIDLTTLSGWGNVANGEHNIQVVAKADGYRDSEKSTAVSFTKGSATVTLSAGTYRFNETLNIPKGTDIEQNITGKMNTLTGNNTYGAQKAFAIMYVAYLDDPTNPTTTMQILDETADNFVIYTGGWQYNDGETGETYPVTDTTKLRTITIETDQQVSQEFKTWFNSNTNVVTGHTLTSSSITPNNIEVNGTALTSLPYTLKNGDTIQVTYTLDGSAITVNGVKQTSNYQTYNLVNTDIVVEAVDGNIEFPSVTINYSNSASGGNIQ